MNEQIFIKSIKIKNFRGIEEAEYTFGAINIFSGANGVGKTSTLDAILWAMTDESTIYGKDGQSNINTHDIDKEVFVELVVSFNGEETIITRTYQNKKKKDNNGDEVYTDPKSTFRIDGIKYDRKADYFDVIKNLSNIETEKSSVNILRFIMDYNYLNLTDNKKTRQYIVDMLDLPKDSILLDKEKYSLIKGLVSKQFKISKKDPFEILPEIIASFNADKRNLDKELKVKQEELENLNAPELGYLSVEDLQKDNLELMNAEFDSSKYDKELKVIEDKKANLVKQANKEVEQATEKLSSLETKGHSIREQLNKVTYELRDVELHIKDQLETISHKKAEIILNKKRLEELANKDYSFVEEVVDLSKFKSVNKCPSCGFELDKESVEKAKQEEIGRVEKYNTRIELEIANSKSIDNGEKDYLVTESLSLTKEIESMAFETRSANSKKSELTKKQDNLTIEMDNLSAEYRKQKEQLVALKDRREAINTSLDMQALLKDRLVIEDNKNKAYADFKANNTNQYEVNNQKINEINSIQKVNDRFNLLKKEIKDINSQLSILEVKKVLVVDLKKEKLDVLQSCVNQVFKHVNFKMVDESLKGATLNVCTPTFDGVNFNGINDGNKYLVGVQMIEDIKAYKGYANLPIIIDRLGDLDSESFDKLLNSTQSQLFFTKVVSKQNEVKCGIIDRKERV